MKISKKIVFIIVSMMSFIGCRDYVEVEPVGNSRVLKYTSDYRGLVNNYNMTSAAGGMYAISSEDTEFTEVFGNTVSDIWKNAYTWQNEIFNNDQSDTDWNALYLGIYYSNVVIEGVLESENGTAQEKEAILAQAYVNRAFSYLQLVNIYAEHYDPQGNNDSKAVPLLLTPDLYSSLERNTVAEVYEQIIFDLEDALDNNIVEEPEFNVLPSKAAVYGLLARTYLYMGAYELSLKNALNALALQNTLLNFNAIPSGFDYPILFENPEVILSKKLLNTYQGAPLAAELLESYDEEDLRYSIYTVDGSSFFPQFEGRGYAINFYSYTNGINVGPSVPEMYLIAAETSARLGEVENAINYLNTLREKRYVTDSEYQLTATDANEALRWTFEERKKELIGRGLRWFDQKRLNLDPNFRKTYTRTFQGSTYTLEPNSEGYVFPVFQNYIDLNPELGE
ncbi:RagB/SusD family nutrient uptake outer membrane protein [Zunongwangia sp. HGR-M22]|uniref:RagB/SusD family nutrient uptake outer membrane protein n=1 Tax=Zunongwangia sp. HGR-M22 TaxID=3015168 RepID=UPI0022DDFCB1|nr:RagB/SusD family nutrient uptake outer membrane protein [Zunongwangia sp. HGR-M22]WBL24343.1 RagB/SusD family nutrient uptake outer membrane protein [Zunongwangia sp. HGR-M22]